MKTTILPVALAIIFLLPVSIYSQSLFWTVNTKDAVLMGDSEGVAVDDSGKIFLSPAITGRFDSGEQFVWSSAVDQSGNSYLGTGGNGKVFKVNKDGKGSLLFDSEEINVSAIAVGSDGSVFAGTSPDGKVYRIDEEGSATVYFEPKTKYIWSLAVVNDGSLIVGTGETGQIFRVSSAGAAPYSSLLYDSRETHVISLASDNDGNVYAGTDSSGLVLKIDSAGKAFAVLDSPLREIHEVSVGPDGSVYALALSESASIATPDPNSADKKAEKTVKVERPDPSTPPAPPAPSKSRYELDGSKSAVYRIAPSGKFEILWNSESITGFSILADPKGGGVYLGTSDRGRVFRISDSARESLLIQTDDEQISTLRRAGDQIVATTSNKGKLFRFGSETVDQGVYRSAVLDAQSTANWGRIWSRVTGSVTIRTRSGNSARPGETWSDWAAVDEDGSVASPAAQYFQWEAQLKAGSVAELSEATLSFAQVNIAPEILSIEVLPPNVGLAANPEIQVDPNIETLGLNPNDFGVAVAPVPPRRVFQAGARAVQWKGSDRNGDTLRYQVMLSKFGSDEFLPVGEPTQAEFITLDGLALEDGQYVVKIVADDSLSNGGLNPLTGESISEPFDIDNSAPRVDLSAIPVRERDNLKLSFTALESSSFIKRAEYSLNRGRWIAAYADDGITDGKTETFTINVNVAGLEGFVVTIRVFDAVGNIGTARFMDR